MKKNGDCQLCNTTQQFVKSHIIPKSFYSKNDKKRLLYPGSKTTKKAPIGVYDYFLCAKCENNFNDLDNYGASIFEGEREYKDIDNVKTEIISTINGQSPDIQKIQLFFLSILWRASSCNHEFFKEVDLGKKHSNIIRKLFLKPITRPQLNLYSIFLLKKPTKTLHAQLCVKPYRERLKGINIYNFDLGQSGYKFAIKVDSQEFRLENKAKNLVLGNHNNIPILMTETDPEFEVILKNSIRQTKKLRKK